MLPVFTPQGSAGGNLCLHVEVNLSKPPHQGLREAKAEFREVDFKQNFLGAVKK
jgi:hypothetical protein